MNLLLTIDCLLSYRHLSVLLKDLPNREYLSDRGVSIDDFFPPSSPSVSICSYTQEFRRLATKLGLRVRIIPLSEHDSYYCLGDVEIWEVSFNTLPSEVLEAMGGCTYPGSNTSISQLRSNSCEKANGCERVSESRADSPATTDATAASSTSDVSVFHPFSKKSVEMLSWGSAPVVTARLVDEIVEIRQDLKGVGTGCFLWASSVILSRLILSSEFDEEVMSMFNPMSFCKSRGPRRPTAIDLGSQSLPTKDISCYAITSYGCYGLLDLSYLELIMSDMFLPISPIFA